MFNRKYIFKGSIFHSYVRLPECIYIVSFEYQETHTLIGKKSSHQLSAKSSSGCSPTLGIRVGSPHWLFAPQEEARLRRRVKIHHTRPGKGFQKNHLPMRQIRLFVRGWKLGVPGFCFHDFKGETVSKCLETVETVQKSRAERYSKTTPSFQPPLKKIGNFPGALTKFATLAVFDESALHPAGIFFPKKNQRRAAFLTTRCSPPLILQRTSCSFAKVGSLGPTFKNFENLCVFLEAMRKNDQNDFLKLCNGRFLNDKNPFF